MESIKEPPGVLLPPGGSCAANCRTVLLEREVQCVHDQVVVVDVEVLGRGALEPVTGPEVAEANCVREVVINLVSGVDVEFLAVLVIPVAGNLVGLQPGVLGNDLELGIDLPADIGLHHHQVALDAVDGGGAGARVDPRRAATHGAHPLVEKVVAEHEERIPAVAAEHARFVLVGRAGVVAGDVAELEAAVEGAHRVLAVQVEVPAPAVDVGGGAVIVRLAPDVAELGLEGEGAGHPLQVGGDFVERGDPGNPDAGCGCVGCIGRARRAVRRVAVELIADARLARGPAVDRVDVVDVVVVVRSADGVAALAGSFTVCSSDTGKTIRFGARPLLPLKTEGPGTHHVAVVDPGVGVEVVAERAGTPGAGLLVAHVKHAVEGVEGHVGALPGDVALRCRGLAAGPAGGTRAGGRCCGLLTPHPFQGVEAGVQGQPFGDLEFHPHSQSLAVEGGSGGIVFVSQCPVIRHEALGIVGAAELYIRRGGAQGGPGDHGGSE